MSFRDDTDRGGLAHRDEETKPSIEGVLQRKASGDGVGDMDVARAGFGDRPGEVPYRAEMERGFGTSFAGVNAHFGEDAGQASRALGAEAYTVGQNVAFANPNPTREVVAHELAHTIQQGGSTPTGGGEVQTFGGEGGFEAEADEAAASVLAGGQAEVNLRTGASVQRWGGSDHYHIGNLAGEKALKKVRALGMKVDSKKVDIAHADKPGTGEDGRKGLKDPVAGETVAVNTGKTWGGLGSEGQISFGAATRYGGDYVTDVDGLKAQTNEADLRLAHDNASMIGGAATNAAHFYPLNQAEYRGHHAKALVAARGGDMSKAMMEEGFANHFLADCFASGHTVPRSLDSVETMHNMDKTSVLSAFATLGGGTSFAENGYKGLMRSKSWHDFFCALPDGLPMSDGNRYHGDYYMDGTDLDRVSDVASESLAEVIAAGNGQHYQGNVRMVTPDFGAIQADPVAGPVWRMMMRDYESDLKKAQEQIKPGSKGKTDSGIGFNSQVALDMIEQNIFGEGKNANATAGDLGTRRHNVVEAFKAIDHYSNAQFNHNAELGPNGQNDDLEAPSEKDKKEKHWDSQKLKDLGLLQGALDAAKSYQHTVMAAGEHAAPGEAELAAQCVKVAQALVDNAERGMFTRGAVIANYGKAMREMKGLIGRVEHAGHEASTVSAQRQPVPPTPNVAHN